MVYFFMKGPRPTVPSVKMADALANYISNYKLQFTFNLKIKNYKFQYKNNCLFSYIHTDRYIVCFSI